MAERQGRERREVRLDHAFDRLFTSKLQQAHEILVPDQVRLVGAAATGAREGYEDRRNSCSGVVGPTVKDDNTIASQTAALIELVVYVTKEGKARSTIGSTISTRPLP